jgi:hypothetical protein
MIHHGNRQGGARGLSKSEDVLDLILKLSRPEGYQASEGARFLVEFTKNRGITGAAVTPFTAQLNTDGWTLEAEKSEAENIAQKIRDYLHAAAAAEELPTSANAALCKIKVNRAEALKAWASMKTTGEIAKTDDGYYALTGSAVPGGSENHSQSPELVLRFPTPSRGTGNRNQNQGRTTSFGEGA